jgi:hypothetical protein
VLRKLAAEADVFITNFPPPVRKKLGVTYKDLAPLNDRLIYASFTGYGETGPEADKPGFDASAWWARSGLMDLVRETDETVPARSMPGMGDPSLRHVSVRRYRHCALSAREDRQRHTGDVQPDGQWHLVQRHLRAGRTLRRHLPETSAA